MTATTDCPVTARDLIAAMKARRAALADEDWTVTADGSMLRRHNDAIREAEAALALLEAGRLLLDSFDCTGLDDETSDRRKP
jgi:hypothetical protein